MLRKKPKACKKKLKPTKIFKEPVISFAQDVREPYPIINKFDNEDDIEIPLFDNILDNEKIKEKIRETKRKFYHKYMPHMLLCPTSDYKTAALAAPFLNDKRIPENLKSFIFSSGLQLSKSEKIKEEINGDIQNLMTELTTNSTASLFESTQNKCTEEMLKDIKDILPDINSFSPRKDISNNNIPLPELPPIKNERTRDDVINDIKDLLQLKSALSIDGKQRVQSKKPGDELLKKFLPRFRTNLTVPNQDDLHRAILQKSKKFTSKKTAEDSFLYPDNEPDFPGLFPEKERLEYLAKSNDFVSAFAPEKTKPERTKENVLEEIKGLMPELVQMKDFIKNLMNTDMVKVEQTPTLEDFNGRPTTPIIQFLRKEIGLEKIEQVRNWLKRREILRSSITNESSTMIINKGHV